MQSSKQCASWLSPQWLCDNSIGHMINVSSCAQVHELPYIQYTSSFNIYIYIYIYIYIHTNIYYIYIHVCIYTNMYV